MPQKRLAKKDIAVLPKICQNCHKENPKFYIKCQGLLGQGIDEKLRGGMSEDQFESLKVLEDPVKWVESEFGIVPRFYQKVMLRCTAQKKVSRIGRRAGKTYTLAMKMLHYAFTNTNKTVLLVAPYQSQVEHLFGILKFFLSKSPNVGSSVSRVTNLPYRLEFFNGSKILGDTAGTKSGSQSTGIRGKDANFLVMDEADFLSKEDINTVTPMLVSDPNHLFWVSSTPTGKRDHFYRFCTDTALGFKEFYYPSSVSPTWTKEIEVFEKSVHSTASYIHEFCLYENELLSVYGLSGKKVVPIKDVRIGQKVFWRDFKGEERLVPITDKKSTGTKNVFEYKTLGGSIKCTPDHGMLGRDGKKHEIQNLKEIAFSYVRSYLYENHTKERRMARLIGFINGDGYVAKRPRTHQASFYGERVDLEAICQDINSIYGISYKPYFHSKALNVETWCVCVNDGISKDLIKYGAIVGKKKESMFEIPPWIMNHKNSNIRAEYIGALYGAEGSTPKAANSSSCVCHSLRLGMTLKSYTLFDQIKHILKKEFEIDVVISNDAFYIIGDDNITKFLSLGLIRYCLKKEIAAFQISLYNKVKKYYKDLRTEKLKEVDLKKDTIPVEKLYKEFGLRGFRHHKRDLLQMFQGKHSRYRTYGVPYQSDWLSEHRLGHFVFMDIVEVVDRGPQKVFNITVDSLNHSYVLANGMHTFNCAGFGSEATGVFQNQYIDTCLEHYKTPASRTDNDSIITMGADWNASEEGTHIVIIEWNEKIGKYKFLKKEIIKQQEFTQQKGVSKIIKLNELWNPSYIYVDAGFGHCVVPETLIQIKTGIKKMLDIVVGDEALTADGTYNKVRAISVRGADKLIKIKGMGILPTMTTKEHPYLCYEMGNRINFFKNKNILSENIKWKKAKDVTKNDLLAIPRIESSKKINLIIDLTKLIQEVDFNDKFIWFKNGFSGSGESKIDEITKLASCSRTTAQRACRSIREDKFYGGSLVRQTRTLIEDIPDLLPQPEKINRYVDVLSPEFLELLGWYLVGGSICSGGFELSLNGLKEQNVAIHLSLLMEKVFGKKGKIYQREENNLVKVICTSKATQKIMKKFGGELATEKRIHPDLMENWQCLGSLVRAVIQGGGCREERGYSITSVSKSLIFQLRQIFINLGILPGVYYRKVQKTSKTQSNVGKILYTTPRHRSYVVHIYCNPIKEEILSCFLGMTLNLNPNRVPRDDYVVTKDFIFSPIREITKDIAYDGSVYDIEIENKHSFVGNGVILHNSQCEMLKKYGVDHPGTGLVKKVKAIDFRKKVNIRDPSTKQLLAKDLKPLMVNVAARFVEEGLVVLPRSEDTQTGLVGQMRDYHVLRTSAVGQPVYSDKNEHTLTAFMLALLAMFLEFSDAVKPNYLTKIAFAGNIGEREHKDDDYKFELDPNRKQEEQNKKLIIIPRWDEGSLFKTRTLSDLSRSISRRFGDSTKVRDGGDERHPLGLSTRNLRRNREFVSRTNF